MSPVEFEDFDSTVDPEADGQNLTRATVAIEVLVDGKLADLSVISVKFEEAVFEHSVLSVTLAPDIKAASGGTDFTAKYLGMVGKSIVIKYEATDSYAVEGAKQRQFQGTVYDVSFEYQASYECKITLHGISNTFKLDQATINQAFLKQKRSDIARTFIGEAALNAELETSKLTEDYIYCHNETRWDFLKRFARSEGHWLYCEGDKVFVKPAAASESASLTWGKDMGTLHARVRTRGNKTIVRGWDYKKKEAIVGKSSSSTELSSAAMNANKLANRESLFKEDSYVDISVGGIASVEQLKMAASSASEGRMSRLASCDGQTNVPGLKVGFTVKLEGSGAAWNSQYFVTKVTHTIEAGSYHNTFEALPMDVAHPVWQNPNPPISGFITGIVTDLKDPDQLGRIKVKYPTLDSFGNEIESDWVRVCSLYAGDNRGIFFLPEIDDEVLVCFERGDLNHPVVIGSLWNGKDKPTMAGAAAGAEKNEIKTIFTKAGHQITFCDKSGEESIKIIDKSEANYITIDTANKLISIVSDKDIAIEAKENITLTAKKDVMIEGQNVTIKAKQGLKEEGMQVDVKASGAMSLEATGNAKLKANMLDLDGGPVCGVKGGVIKLN